jgi:hypothetical protein
MMVGDLVSAKHSPRVSYSCQPRVDYFAERRTDPSFFLGAPDFTQQLIELSQLWQIYCGLSPLGTTHSPLCIQMPMQTHK